MTEKPRDGSLTKHRRPDEVFVALTALLLVWWPDPTTDAFGTWNFVALTGGGFYLAGFVADRYTHRYGIFFRTLGALTCLGLWIVTDWHFFATDPRSALACLFLLLSLYTAYSLALTHRPRLEKWLHPSTSSETGHDESNA